MPQREDPVRGIPVVELVFEWVLPVIGGTLTFMLALWLNVSPGWALLLALPGAVAFPLACALCLGLLASAWPDRVQSTEAGQMAREDGDQ